MTKIENSRNIYLKLRDIVDYLYSQLIKRETLFHLSNLIASFLLNYAKEYGSFAIKPKFHYMLHFPYYINLYGSLRNIFCFPFEKKHQYFELILQLLKKIVKNSFNFINISHTLANRHKLLLPKNFGNKNIDMFKCNSVQNIKNITIDKSSDDLRMKEKTMTDSLTINMTYKIVLDGFNYSIDDNIVYVLTITNSAIPIFFSLLNILYINDTWYFSGTLFIPDVYTFMKNMLTV